MTITRRKVSLEKDPLDEYKGRWVLVFLTENGKLFRASDPHDTKEQVEALKVEIENQAHESVNGMYMCHMETNTLFWHYYSCRKDKTYTHTDGRPVNLVSIDSFPMPI